MLNAVFHLLDSVRRCTHFFIFLFFVGGLRRGWDAVEEVGGGGGQRDVKVEQMKMIVSGL